MSQNETFVLATSVFIGTFLFVVLTRSTIDRMLQNPSNGFAKAIQRIWYNLQVVFSVVAFVGISGGILIRMNDRFGLDTDGVTAAFYAAGPVTVLLFFFGLGVRFGLKKIITRKRAEKQVS